jgi:hypothetical protein
VARFGRRTLAADPPGWDGEQRGEPGIHGLARARRWDVVTAVRGVDVGSGPDALAFAVLPDGTVVGDAGAPVAQLRAAVEESLRPPYRAEAVHRDAGTWAVAARRIVVVREPRLAGARAEVVRRDGERGLRVDGVETGRRALALEELGERVGEEYVVQATYLADGFWEAEASPL